MRTHTGEKPFSCSFLHIVGIGDLGQHGKFLYFGMYSERAIVLLHTPEVWKHKMHYKYGSLLFI